MMIYFQHMGHKSKSIKNEVDISVICLQQYIPQAVLKEKVKWDKTV